MMPSTVLLTVFLILWNMPLPFFLPEPEPPPPSALPPGGESPLLGVAPKTGERVVAGGLRSDASEGLPTFSADGGWNLSEGAINPSSR